MKLTGKRWKKQFLLFINTSIYTIKYLYYCIRKKNFSQISQENVGLFEDERT